MTTSRAIQAIHVLLGLFLLVVLFHLAVLLRLIPYDIVWAGRLGSDAEMYRFEGISLLLNLLLIGLLLLKRQNLQRAVRRRWLDALLGLFGLLFALNTLGNLTAESAFERWAFTPLTLISALLIFAVLRAQGGRG